MKLRLGELRWNQTDLAREISKFVHTTPAAISYMFAKAKQSSLRPYIEKVIGWERVNAVDWEATEDASAIADAVKKAAQDDEGEALARAILLSPSATRQNLIAIIDELTEAYRVELLIEARRLVGLQRVELQHNREYEQMLRRRDDLGERMRLTYKQSAAVSARRDQQTEFLEEMKVREDRMRSRVLQLQARHTEHQRELEGAENALASAKSQEAEKAKQAARVRTHMSARELRESQAAVHACVAARERAEKDVQRLRGEQTQLGAEIVEAAKKYAEAAAEVERESQRLAETRDRILNPDSTADED